MRKPTRAQIRDYELNVTLNQTFRSLDCQLAGTLTPEERVVVMAAIWPQVKKITSQILQRVIQDFS